MPNNVIVAGFTFTRSRLLAATIAMLSARMTIGHGQDLAPHGSEHALRTEFEFASVKPSVPPFEYTGVNKVDDKITFMNVTLRDCLAQAYGINRSLIKAPDWADADRFTIVAGLPAETTDEEVRLMLRRLLAARFSVKTHTERVQTRVYALEVGPSGPRLRVAKGGRAMILPLTGSAKGWSFKNVSLEGFLQFVRGVGDQSLSRPVIDATNLSGLYDFEFVWSPDYGSPDKTGPSIFSAIRDLGLRFASIKTPLDNLVVDTAKRTPTPN